MGIFSFREELAIGEVRRIDTGRVWVRVTSAERLRAARVGRLVAIKGGVAFGSCILVKPNIASFLM